ncbi:MAG: DEAD/DEAH box helicase, partial [Anaerolineales bacterium]|nr:DEAD/DEAH box helicase [Anaerolineales bacterium]
QHRLAFGEMFLLQLGVLRQKQDWEQLVSEPLQVEDQWLDHFTNNLPYTLTNAQKGALDDIRKDMTSSKPMNRLLQGDVGSGKTVVAAAAIGISAANKAQSVFMAPTSILAEQHVQTLRELLPVSAQIPEDSIRLLIGATPEAEKNEIRQGLEDGAIQVIVGTHALIEDPVNFKRLGLVIIDEQHRFGVEQRAALRDKGQNPNLLVMTATPIPRSLALTVFGDLDLTLLDEMPPGRQPVDTRVLLPRERARAHVFVGSQIEKGKQAFIIYPLVEGSEKVQAKAAVDEHQTLQENVFPSYKVGLLHGRMRQEEKEQVMDGFRKGEYEVLVSTSVVEVGVDIQNATVMLIEGA